MSTHYATSVYRDRYLYGYHGRQEYGPSFRVEFKTGTVKWSEDPISRPDRKLHNLQSRAAGCRDGDGP